MACPLPPSEVFTAAWAAYDHWLVRWREAHPDDERSDLELIDVYWTEILPVPEVPHA
jgi:hypothetical protein